MDHWVQLDAERDGLCLEADTGETGVVGGNRPQAVLQEVLMKAAEPLESALAAAAARNTELSLSVS
jgi:hypothetical protein